MRRTLTFKKQGKVLWSQGEGIIGADQLERLLLSEFNSKVYEQVIKVLKNLNSASGFLGSWYQKSSVLLSQDSGAGL